VYEFFEESVGFFRVVDEPSAAIAVDSIAGELVPSVDFRESALGCESS